MCVTTTSTWLTTGHHTTTEHLIHLIYSGQTVSEKQNWFPGFYNSLQCSMNQTLMQETSL